MMNPDMIDRYLHAISTSDKYPKQLRQKAERYLKRSVLEFYYQRPVEDSEVDKMSQSDKAQEKALEKLDKHLPNGVSVIGASLFDDEDTEISKVFCQYTVDDKIENQTWLFGTCCDLSEYILRKWVECNDFGSITFSDIYEHCGEMKKWVREDELFPAFLKGMDAFEPKGLLYNILMSDEELSDAIDDYAETHGHCKLYGGIGETLYLTIKKEKYAFFRIE